MRTAPLALLALFIGLKASAEVCWPGDLEFYRSTRTEIQDCVEPGYCHLFDFNPMVGQFEIFYGYHTACPGYRERHVTDISCESAGHYRYTTREAGLWSQCQLSY